MAVAAFVVRIVVAGPDFVGALGRGPLLAR